jgi:hypothetical protein
MRKMQWQEGVGDIEHLECPRETQSRETATELAFQLAKRFSSAPVGFSSRAMNYALPRAIKVKSFLF